MNQFAQIPADRASPYTRRTVVSTGAASVALAALAVRSQRQTAAHEGTPDALPEAAGETSYLLVQAGFSSGMLDQATEGVQSWLLQLQGAPAQTVFFSDRPARIAGAVSTERFLEMLDFSPDNPPNAALVIESEDGVDVAILKLTEPTYDAAAETLTYITKILDDERLEHSGYGFGEAPLDAESYPPEFGPASLFIDSLLGCDPWNPRGC